MTRSQQIAQINDIIGLCTLIEGIILCKSKESSIFSYKCEYEIPDTLAYVRIHYEFERFGKDILMCSIIIGAKRHLNASTIFDNIDLINFNISGSFSPTCFEFSYEKIIEKFNPKVDTTLKKIKEFLKSCMNDILNGDPPHKYVKQHGDCSFWERLF